MGDTLLLRCRTWEEIMNQDRQLPEEQLRIYLSNPNRCPWCGGEVLVGRVETDDI